MTSVSFNIAVVCAYEFNSTSMIKTGKRKVKEKKSGTIVKLESKTVSKSLLILTLGLLDVVHYVKQTEEEFIPHTHEKQHRLWKNTDVRTDSTCELLH